MSRVPVQDAGGDDAGHALGADVCEMRGTASSGQGLRAGKEAGARMSKTEVVEKPAEAGEEPVAAMVPPVYDRAVARMTAQRRRGPIVVTLPASVRVSYEEPAEFLQELEELAKDVERGTVRYTIRYDPPGEGYGMRKVELVVSAIAGGEIFELVARAGAVWGDGGEVDLATKKRVDTWHAALVELCGKAGLTLKSGRFGAV